MSDSDFSPTRAPAARDVRAASAVMQGHAAPREPTVNDDQPMRATRRVAEREIDCSATASGGYWDLPR
jgi:hypothetical protein